MTKEEIKQKAEEWMRNNSERCTKENMNGYNFAIATCIAVTTEATKELEAQIEKMKCCENCKHSNTTCECYTICTIGHYDDCKSNTVLDSLDKKDYWGN